MPLFSPFLYQLNPALSFAMEVSKSETGPCNPVSLATSNHNCSLFRLESFSFWAILSLFRAYGIDYMRPAGFYKGLWVIIIVAGVWRRKVVKKMNAGDLHGMTLERIFEI